jgi:glycine/D-amino acid oxidase-like deaminating enzyme
MQHTRHGYWLEEAGPVEPLAPLSGEEWADVVVMGGGYTGMWAAWFIGELEPGARVVLLEAEDCGSGPSGRNGGFVNAMWFSLPTLRRRFGDAAAMAVARTAAEAVEGVGRWCDEQGVDAWYRRAGYLHVSAAPAQDGASDEAVRACAELGEPDACRSLEAGELRSRCASPVFRGGAFFPGAATVQPARLALGLRARLIERGVRVFERSRVRRVAASGGSVTAETASGRVLAGAAVLAAGGRLVATRPLRRRLTVTSSHIVITEPVPDVLEEVGWTGGECITDSRALVHYFRTTPDGRIAFGWGGGRLAAGPRLGGRVEVDPGVARQVAEHLRRFFPRLRERRLAHAWGGPIDVSPTHLPVIANIGPDRVHAAFGYTGNGVGPSRMVGRALAGLALDRRDEHTRLAIVDPPRVHVPPEPFRYIGGTIVRAAVVRKEAAEDEGREPDRLSALVASIPERIGVQLGR